MSDFPIGMGGVPPTVLATAAVVLALVAAVVLVLAPSLSTFLVRRRATWLPSRLSERLLEEWLAEIDAIESRIGKLTYALALALTRTKALTDAVGDESDHVLPPGHVLVSVADVRVPSEFTSRLMALIVDNVIIVAVMMALLSLTPRAVRDLPFASVVLNALWFALMQVYFVQRFGGSPGKLLLKLRIVTVDGAPLTVKHTFLRAAPEQFLFATGAIAATAFVLSGMSWSDYIALAGPARQQAEAGLIPIWFKAAYFTARYAWNLADVGVFWASDERRALHDLLAGTIVLHKVPVVVGEPDNLAPPTSTSLMR